MSQKLRSHRYKKEYCPQINTDLCVIMSSDKLMLSHELKMNPLKIRRSSGRVHGRPPCWPALLNAAKNIITLSLR